MHPCSSVEAVTDKAHAVRDWLTIGAVAFLVRLAIVLAVPVGEVGDMAGWVETARRVSLEGVQAAYSVLSVASLYPPGFMYPLWATGQAYIWCCSPGFETDTQSIDILMRLAPILADTGVAILVGCLAAASDGNRRLQAGLLYALNPAILTTVAWKGMIGDPYYVLFILLGLLSALHSHPIASIVCMTLGVLVKPQALALVPLISAILLTRASLQRLLLGALAGLATTLFLLIPFVLGGTLGDLWAALRQMGVVHAYTQNSADNLWALLPVWRLEDAAVGPNGQVPDTEGPFPGLIYRDLGLMLFGLLYLVTLARLVARDSPRQVVLAGSVIALGFFFLNTRMHVNYVFLAFPLLCALAPAGGLRPRLALAAATLACLIDWDVPAVLPWGAHRANAGLYLASLLMCWAAFHAGLPRLSLRLINGRRAVARPVSGRTGDSSSPAS
jgi:hypothetical protein